MTQNLRPIRVCLIMHSTRSDNLGVGALTVSEVEILRDLAARLGRRIEMTFFDWKDARTPYVSGSDIRIVDFGGKELLDPRRYFATARRSDMVIDIGAGDSFADIYGGKRLRRMFIMKYLAHLAGTPLILAPQTIGPFTRASSRALARLSMKWSSVVASRDKLSTEAARDLGITGVVEASDVALRLPYDAPAPRAAGGPVRVGLNVSGLLFGGGYTGKNEFGLTMDYPALVRDILRHFHALGCEVHLVPHVLVASGPMRGEDDSAASATLAAEFPGTIVAPRFASPSEAKSYIAGLDFFIGARMHACIAAFSSGVPVIPMAYSRKFEGLFGSIGFTRTVDCTSEAPEAIMKKIKAGFEDRATVKAEADAALARGKAKLVEYENALLAVMRRIKT